MNLILKELIFRPLDLRQEDLKGKDLSGAYLEGANLSGMNLQKTCLRGANLTGTDLSGANLKGAILDGACLKGANLYRTDFCNAHMVNADLRNVHAHFAMFGAGDLREADLRGADMRDADFYFCDFIGADFTGANITGATLMDADLSEAKGLLSASDYLCNHFEWTPQGLIAYKQIGMIRVSPKSWKIEKGSVLRENVNFDRCADSGSGVQVATADWIQRNCTGTVWKVLIRFEWLAGICVPYHTDGQIRCEKVQLLEEFTI